MAKKQSIIISTDVDLIALLTDHYEIANTYAEADVFKSTTEVMQLLQQIVPGEDIQAMVLVKNMKDYGFVMKVDDGEAHWLLKELK